MGINGSKAVEKANSLRNKNHVHSTYDPDRKVPIMSNREKELLKETWQLVKGDISKVGVITFIR